METIEKRIKVGRKTPITGIIGKSIVLQTIRVTGYDCYGITLHWWHTNSKEEKSHNTATTEADKFQSNASECKISSRGDIFNLARGEKLSMKLESDNIPNGTEVTIVFSSL